MVGRTFPIHLVRKSRGKLMNVVKLQGCHLSAKAGSFKRALYSGRAKRVKIAAAGSIWKIPSEIFITRITDQAFELLWMVALFQEVPVSLPAWVPVGQSQRAGLSWVKSGESFILFLPKLFQSQWLYLSLNLLWSSWVHYPSVLQSFS